MMGGAQEAQGSLKCHHLSVTLTRPPPQQLTLDRRLAAREGWAQGAKGGMLLGTAGLGGWRVAGAARAGSWAGLLGVQAEDAHGPETSAPPPSPTPHLGAPLEPKMQILVSIPHTLWPQHTP